MMVATLFEVGAESASGSESYLVFDVGSGEVLLSENADTPRQIASLTKVATAVLVFEWVSSTSGSLDEKMVVTPLALLGGANQMQLVAGDSVSVGGALYAAMMASDNTSAAALAEHIGRSLSPQAEGKEAINVFVSKMNDLASRLGMEDTHFINPHGLDLNTEQGISTAHDVALLTRHALGIPGLLEYCSEKQITVQTELGGAPREVVVENTNQLLGRNGIDGMKTGTTRRSGPCLIATVAKDSEEEGERRKVRIASVLLGAEEDRFTRTESLLEMGWRNLERDAENGAPDADKEYLRKPAN